MTPTTPNPSPAPGPNRSDDALYGSIPVRLSARDWIVTAAVAIAALLLVPVIGPRADPFQPGTDYRTPEPLSNDYLVFARHARQAAGQSQTLIVGDSVMWGEHVAADQTLAHELNALAGQPGRERFANLGVEGVHPLALEGLLRYYGGAIRNQRVILHCNLLWMTSPRADLSSRSEKDVSVNHPSLIPQFVPHVPAYKASISDRMGIVIGHALPWGPWVRHWRVTHYGNLDLPTWSVDHPYANPFHAIDLDRPADEQPKSPARPASQADQPSRQNFPWVPPGQSLQFQAFQRVVTMLARRDRGNAVFVIVGPFNEHMLTDASRARYRQVKSAVANWLHDAGVAHFVPDALPADDYADASHPLSQGYTRLARQLLADDAFRRFDGASTAGQQATSGAEDGPARVGSRAAQPSPQSRPEVIVFCSNRTGQWRIHSIAPDGTGLRQLTRGTEDDADVDPAISPDGRSILFSSTRQPPGGKTAVWRMALAALPGGAPARICDGDQAEWSPDGGRIVLRRDERIVVRDLASGKESVLTGPDMPHCSGPAFSPDGKTIAFACRWDAGNGLYTINSAPGPGTKPVKVYDKQGACEPHWSPTGDRLVYETETNICTINPDGTKNRMVTYYGGVQRYARFSPDGQRLVFCQAPSPAGPWEIYTVPATGGDPTRLIPEKSGPEGGVEGNAEGNSDMYPDWR